MKTNALKHVEMKISIQNDRYVFGAAVLGIFTLCLLLYPLSGTFIEKTFTADFGIFSNLTVIMLLLTLALTIRSQTGARRHFIIMIFLCLFMIGEELEWLQAFEARSSQALQITTVKDIVIAAFGEVNDKAGLEVVMSIAAGRFLLIVLPLYALVFLVLYRKAISEYLGKSENSHEIFHGTVFVMLLVFSIFCRSHTDPLPQILEKGTSLSMGAALLLYNLTRSASKNQEAPDKV